MGADDHAESAGDEDPEDGEHDGDFSEEVTGSGAEGTLAAHTTECAGQSAAAAALDEHQQDEDQADESEESGEEEDQEGHGEDGFRIWGNAKRRN